MMGDRKVYMIAFLCLGVAKKYAFDNARGKWMQAIKSRQDV